MTLKWEFHETHEKNHHDSKKNHKNLISRWVRVIIWYKLFSWSKTLRKKFFHKKFFIKEFSPSDIWIDVFRKFCCDINKCSISLLLVYFGECTWPVAFERTHLQGLTHSRSWDIWIGVNVIFRWFQPEEPRLGEPLHEWWTTFHGPYFDRYSSSNIWWI